MTSSQLVPEMTAFLITHNLTRIFHCIYIFDKVYIGAISSDITFESFKNYNLWKSGAEISKPAAPVPRRPCHRV